jgi:hypothetical protein
VDRLQMLPHGQLQAVYSRRANTKHHTLISMTLDRGSTLSHRMLVVMLGLTDNGQRQQRGQSSSTRHDPGGLHLSLFIHAL